MHNVVEFFFVVASMGLEAGEWGKKLVVGRLSKIKDYEKVLWKSIC